MFVILRHGDGEKTLFNPDCRVHVFERWIKRLCHIPADAAVDLCGEKGELKRIMGREEYVSKFLEHRMTYIPVIVHRNESGRLDRIIPCLVAPETYYPKLAAQLGHEVKTGVRAKDSIRRFAKKPAVSAITVTRPQHTRIAKKRSQNPICVN